MQTNVHIRVPAGWGLAPLEWSEETDGPEEMMLELDFEKSVVALMVKNWMQYSGEKEKHMESPEL